MPETVTAERAAGLQPAFEFEVQLGPYGPAELAVLELEVEEALSTPFTATVTVVARHGAEVDAAAILGEDALLSLHAGPDHTRFVQGLVARIDAWDTGGGPDRRRYVARIVPRLWTLGQGQRSRVFQEATAPEIVAQVLDEGGVTVRPSLSATYPARDYCVQYRESDLQFVSRLLEEEGIYYWFEHAKDGHVMVLADAVSAVPALPVQAELPYREPGVTDRADAHVDGFQVQREVRPSKVELRDYDYLRPSLDLSSAAAGAGGGLAVYDYPGRYEDPAGGRARSRVRLEELRVRAELAAGTGTVRWLAPGATFALQEHPIAGFDGEYLICSVRHHGEQPEALGGQQRGPVRRYHNSFTCLPKAVPYRPARRALPPVIPGAQTARVVGPAGEEIFTDAHGRIKVQFHWDREGKRDERSSCWVRVAQAWAGPGFGALYLPRIGHEVLVEFLEGNPDRPVVTGSVYNGDNPPPVSLPAEKTRSTLRSASSPASDGFNELRFEDAAGSEEVFLHAQRDLAIEVGNDKTQRVGGNETLTVEKDRSRTVEGNQSLRVEKDDTSTVLQNQLLTVGRDRSTTVGGNQTETVARDQAVTIAGSASLTVGLAASEAVALAKALSVGGAYAVTVGAAMNELVGGLKAEEVGGAKVELVGASRSENVVGDRSLRVGGDLTESVGKSRTVKIGEDLVLNVGGSIQQGAGGQYTVKAKELVLSAADQLTLKVGGATIQMSKNGDVVVKGAKFEVKASGPVVLKGSSVTEN